ncbi:hypothetical protein [Streptomyces sp. NPDC020965]|uniref:hypothetical protein n=1 Tax=Streptomyces sp. NPDC020965 TaxID=3365105 RepID=UPI00379C1427
MHSWQSLPGDSRRGRLSPTIEEKTYPAVKTALHKARAKAPNARVAGMTAATEGHDACRPRGARWVEPALFFDQLNPAHPNALGESEMAGQAMRALNIG